MKVLLTGGSGLIGTEIRNALLKNDVTVYATSRKEQQTENPQLNWIQTDFEDVLPSFFEKLPNVDVLIHNAACIDSGNINNIQSIQKVNITFTSQLFTWAISKKIQTIIFISSYSFIQKPLPSLITEQSAVAPDTFYSMSKYWGEMLLNEYSKNSGFRNIIYRISSPICFDLKRLPNNVVKKMITAGMNKEPIKIFGEGKREQNFVATTDVAEAIVLATKNTNVSGVFNIASESTLSMKNLAKLIAHKYSVSIELVGTDPLENEVWNISTSKAQKELGYSPRFSSSEKVILQLLEGL